MGPLVPRPRHELVDELRRCADTRDRRQAELLAAMVKVDAVDRRMADLIDELSLHHRQGAGA